MRLDRVVDTSGPLDHVVLRLIEWAGERGKLKQLFVAVARRQSNNPRIESILRLTNLTLNEGPQEFLVGVSTERKSTRGWFVKSLLLLPVLNFVPGLAPLSASPTILAFATALVMLTCVIVSTFAVSNFKVPIRRGIALVAGVLVLGILLQYVQLHDEYIYVKREGADEVYFTKGTEFTDVAKLLRDDPEGYGSEAEIIDRFESPFEIWTEASIVSTERRFRNWWFTFWVLLSIFFGVSIQEFRRTEKI